MIEGPIKLLHSPQARITTLEVSVEPPTTVKNAKTSHTLAMPREISICWGLPTVGAVRMGRQLLRFGAREAATTFVHDLGWINNWKWNVGRKPKAIKMRVYFPLPRLSMLQ